MFKLCKIYYYCYSSMDINKSNNDELIYNGWCLTGVIFPGWRLPLPGPKTQVIPMKVPNINRLYPLLFPYLDSHVSGGISQYFRGGCRVHWLIPGLLIFIKIFSVVKTICNLWGYQTGLVETSPLLTICVHKLSVKDVIWEILYQSCP